MTDRLPALFVSHGSPMLAIQDGPARRFLTTAAAAWPAPRAILVVSAHWETPLPAVSTARAPRTIHDFGGFPRALYDIRYQAPGAPDVGRAALALLEAAGIPATADPDRGLDHGAWVPLHVMLPAANVPVTVLSVQPQADPAHHYRVGAALRPLRDDGVLILASGALTHNLHEFFAAEPDAESPDWVRAFADWIADAVAAGRTEALLDYRRQAPFASRNHPTDEHLLPLFAALGAGTPGVGGRVLHRSTDRGVLAMDSYAFD